MQAPETRALRAREIGRGCHPNAGMILPVDKKDSTPTSQATEDITIADLPCHLLRILRLWFVIHNDRRQQTACASNSLSVGDNFMGLSEN